MAQDATMTMSTATTSSSVALRVSGITKTYGKGATAQLACSDISFDVRAGEFLSIVGPSGCGKTTLIKIIAGLLKASSGHVELFGQRVESVPHDLSVVFQDYSRSLFPWLRVAANVSFPLDHLPISKAERSERVASALAAVGLRDSGEKYPWQLSGGMQQRVAIARAIAYRPKLLLMDEPFASVDAQTRAELEDLTLKVHNDHGMTTLFITHDIDESVYLADRVVVLRRSPGRLMTTLDVGLPHPRDQIATREDSAFVKLRGEIARLVRAAALGDDAPQNQR